MLPDDPVLARRLLRAARCMMDWNQSRVAAQAGVSTAAVSAVERGRLAYDGQAARAIVGAFERAGVRFLDGQHGAGLAVGRAGCTIGRTEGRAVPVASSPSHSRG